MNICSEVIRGNIKQRFDVVSQNARELKFLISQYPSLQLIFHILYFDLS